MKAPVLESAHLSLQADTAAELMTENPVSVSQTAKLARPWPCSSTRASSAAPVMDEAGRPVGVLSRSDLLVHDREQAEHVRPAPEYYDRRELTASGSERLGAGFQVENVDRTLVRDIMPRPCSALLLQIGQQGC